MEPDEVPAALRRTVRVHQAEGVLAALLDVPVEQAAVSLDLKAQFSGVSLDDAAARVLDDHERGVGVDVPTGADDRTLAVLRQHLDRTTSPLDTPTS